MCCLTLYPTTSWIVPVHIFAYSVYIYVRVVLTIYTHLTSVAAYASMVIICLSPIADAV